MNDQTVPRWEIRQADVLEGLRAMPDESVHCVVTSPPYWGLRNYGLAEWIDGDSECPHTVRNPNTSRQSISNSTSYQKNDLQVYHGQCRRCGAIRVDKGIGLEPTFDEYLDKMVQVFAEVRRVLRTDGTLWLNIGDCYQSGDRRGQVGDTLRGNTSSKQRTNQGSTAHPSIQPNRTPQRGLKPKDLVGMPWRVALALQADGWYLRRDIIWHKSNPMPESVRDRPSNAHEYVFLLTKAERYYYDAEAVKEPVAGTAHARRGYGEGASASQGVTPKSAKSGSGIKSNESYHAAVTDLVAKRSLRDVWTIPTQSYPEAHFATYPEKLVEPCIFAGTSEHGVCIDCGAPWGRIVVKGDVIPDEPGYKPRGVNRPTINGIHIGSGMWAAGSDKPMPNHHYEYMTTGWEPSCKHEAGVGSAVVLDPFAGSGTTGVVALRNGRSFIGIELSAEYAELARKRIRNDAPLLNTMNEGWK